MFEIQNQFVYDLFYQNKPYQIEALTFLSLYFKRYSTFPSSIIEIGAGTGKLSCEMMSLLPMLKYTAVEPNSKFANYLSALSTKYSSFNSINSYFSDAVTSLKSSSKSYDLAILNFNVVNYFTLNDLSILFKQLASVASSGRFSILFDTWSFDYLCMHDSMGHSIRNASNGDITFERDSSSRFNALSKTIDITFKFSKLSSGEAKTFIGEEIHNLNIFTLAELKSVLLLNGFTEPAFYSFDQSLIKMLEHPKLNKNILCFSSLAN